MGALFVAVARQGLCGNEFKTNAIPRGRTNNLVARRSKLAIPQISRSAVVNAFKHLQNNLVTSQIVPVECTTSADPEWPLFS